MTFELPSGLKEKRILLRPLVWCNNVIRQEYNPIGYNYPCCVCGSDNWIEIKMNEVRK